jgi:hypothetical protein
MSDFVFGYPISGESVCDALNSIAGPKERWVIRAIETLTSKNSLLLGDLWKEARVSEIEICTKDFCSALFYADQVISLDIHLLHKKQVELLIEDGFVVLNSLRSAPPDAEGG